MSSHRWVFPMNQCPHAAFQKPHLLFMMRINTILLTAQDLISVFYKTRQHHHYPWDEQWEGWGQGVRRARYSLINKPGSDRTGGWHPAATKPLWTPFCGLLYCNQKHSCVKYQGHNCTLRVRQFHFLLSQRRKPRTMDQWCFETMPWSPPSCYIPCTPCRSFNYLNK